MMMLGSRLATHLLHCMSPEVAHIPRSRLCTSSAAIGGLSDVRSMSPDR
jgi:hypothetical protein